VGGWAGDLVALTPGIRVDASGLVGFAAVEPRELLPVETAWSARYVKLPEAAPAGLRAALFQAPLELSQGKSAGVAFWADLQAADFGVAGRVPAGAPALPYLLPLRIAGVNRNWDAAVWRDDGTLDRFGVFEGRGYARLDTARAGRFYAGNLIVADRPEVHLTVLDWDPHRILVEANNPGAVDVETELRTPRLIEGLYPLRQKVRVAAGRTVRFRFTNGGMTVE
jgi:hypothetical protein